MKLIIEEPQNLLRWTSQTAWLLLCSDKWYVLLVYIYSGCYLVMLVYCSNIRVFELRQTSCEIIYEWVFHFYLGLLTCVLLIGIMAQAGDNMAAYRIPANAGNSIPTQPIIQNLQPRDTPNDVVPPSDKEPKSKDKSKHKRKHQDHKYSGEPSNHKGSKKMKQKILEFPISYSLANISAITNSGFFTNDFYPNHIIKLDSISNLEHHVLNKNDDFV